ncbi:MAG: sensor histidine kinase [Candidatus Corynebacterium faecigallinarum]
MATYGRVRRRIPLGAVETVIAAGMAVAQLWMLEEPVGPLAILVASLMVGVVALTARLPLVAALLSLLVPTSALFLGSFAVLFALFYAALVLEIVVVRGLLTVGIFLFIAHWALSTVDLVHQVLYIDLMSLVMVFVVLLVAYLIGWNRFNQHQRQQMLRDSLAQQAREQRLELARELHDSVATSLTSVVMRAQALGLATEGTGDTETRSQLEGISDTSRDALDQLRTMLRLLNEEPASATFRTRGDSRPLKKAFSTVSKEMRAHGLKVSTTVDLPWNVNRAANRPTLPDAPSPGSPWFDRDTVSKVLTEMASNAVKHASPRSTVMLDCYVDGTCLVLIMSNDITGQSSSEDDPVLSSGLGLGSMQARASKAGGVLKSGIMRRDATFVEAGPTGKTTGHGEKNLPDGEESSALVWRTLLRLPIVVIEP